MKNFQFSIFNLRKGFTLIELMVSLSIFIIVVMLSMGSILGIFDANRKSKSLKSVMSNLNLAVESMSKEMRYGWNYHCGSSGTITVAQNCPAGDTFMSFLSSDNEQISYRLNGAALEKQINGGDFVAVTAPEVTIQSLKFYTLGAGLNNVLQPKVLILLKGSAGSGKDATGFILETMVSQRRVDVEQSLPYAYQAPYAYPTPITYRTLTVSKAGAGSGTVSGPSINCGASCSTSYADGSNVTLTASAAGGSTFTGWSGACSGTGNCSLTMTSDKNVTATFGIAYSYQYQYQYQYQSPVQSCWEPGGYGSGAGCPGDNICLFNSTCSTGSCWPSGYPRNNVNGCCSGAEVGGGEICP